MRKEKKSLKFYNIIFEPKIVFYQIKKMKGAKKKEEMSSKLEVTRETRLKKEIDGKQRRRNHKLRLEVIFLF